MFRAWAVHVNQVGRLRVLLQRVLGRTMEFAFYGWRCVMGVGLKGWQRQWCAVGGWVRSGGVACQGCRGQQQASGHAPTAARLVHARAACPSSLPRPTPPHPTHTRSEVAKELKHRRVTGAMIAQVAGSDSGRGARLVATIKRWRAWPLSYAFYTWQCKLYEHQ